MRPIEIEVDYSPSGRTEVDLGNYILYLRTRGYSPGDDLDDVLFLQQVHGNEILTDPAPGSSADGILLSRPGRMPGIRTADCLPIFIASGRFIAAAHAGWRGLAGGIAGRLLSIFPDDPEIVVLGNCICGRCYEVGPEVLSALREWIPEDEGGTSTVDLKEIALKQLVSAGLNPSSQVMSIPECTLCRSDILYSYRADPTPERNLTWLSGK